MDAPHEPSPEQLRRVVEVFWETFPPFWHRIRAHIRQTATERFGISVEQFHLLRHIHAGQCSVSDLARVKGISRAAISQAVEALVARGFVTRTTDTQDRRHVHLALSESGQALLQAIAEDTRAWMMQLLSPLRERERRTLARAMELLRKIE